MPSNQNCFMKYLLLFTIVGLLIFSCKDSSKEKTTTKTGKAPSNSKHLISKDGIGELKIGMTKKDIEKLLQESLVMQHANDTGEVWSDTAVVKYNEIEVTLYFQKIYSENPTDEMELYGLGTSSPLCRTADGLGVGDDKYAVLAAYEDNPISMGPENIQLNDTTWGFSKTNYNIYVSDDKWDKQISFVLVNKKVAKIEAILHMGD